MLTALRLGNFKAFAYTQRIPIRPLTLIFGANSSGKSSLMHGLLLARHALETGDLEVHRTAVGGESVDLGGFRQYVHRREASRQVEWAMELDTARFTGRLAELLSPVRIITLAAYIGLEQVEKTRQRKGFDPRTGESIFIKEPTGELISVGDPYVQSWRVLADGHPIMTMSRRRDESLRLDRLDREHPIIRNILKSLVEAYTTVESEGLTATDYQSFYEALDDLVPEIAVHIEKFLPTSLLKKETASTTQEHALLRPVSRGQRKEQLADALRLFLPYNLDELLKGVSDVAGSELTRVQYLGPLRSYPPRHLAFSQHHDPNWFAGGGYAWDVVRRNEKVRKAVNEWLGSEERLQTPYEMVVRELVGIDQLETPITQGIEEIEIDIIEEGHWGGEYKGREYDPEPPVWGIRDPEVAAARLQEEIRHAEIDKLQELILLDRRTNTVVSHRDVGIGISQVLPVLVAAYASTEKILAMEQPEIHLHPALQAELGDVFIQSALGEQRNTFILETHSEHLILRILRRIRETTDGELEPGLMPIRPEHVAVLYVSSDKNGARVIEIPIRPDGEFVEHWPQGFFAERAKELF